MADSGSTSDADEESGGGSVDATPGGDDSEARPDGESTGTDEELSDAELRRRVEEEYDFEDFGPRDMSEMDPEEWEAAFDAETWITGDELIDRVRRDLERRIADRDVFAVLEEVRTDGHRCLLVYSDEDYALVHPDGTVEGFGTVLRDVKPTVALCSMDSYEPDDPPAEAILPTPDEVPEASGELGNLMLQIIAGVQLLAGIGMLGAWLIADLTVVIPVAALGFIVIALVLFTTVANARLADKYRAEEYRDRLRAVGLEDGERPDFLPEVEERSRSVEGDDAPDPSGNEGATPGAE